VPEPSVQQPLSVLLGRFASRSDAADARILARDDLGEFELWAAYVREGEDPQAREDDRLWEAIAVQVMDDCRVQLTSGAPGLPGVVGPRSMTPWVAPTTCGSD